MGVFDRSDRYLGLAEAFRKAIFADSSKFIGYLTKNDKRRRKRIRQANILMQFWLKDKFPVCGTIRLARKIQGIIRQLRIEKLMHRGDLAIAE